MIRVGDQVFVCPKCGSDDLVKDDHSGCGMVLVLLAFIFAPVLFLPALFIGVPYFIYHFTKKDNKDKVWSVQCKTCHNCFKIPDPTLNRNDSN